MRQSFFLLFLILIVCSSCGQNDLHGDLPEGLERAYCKARKAKNIRSLLVSHRGKLIGEEYFDRYSADSLDHVRSVTKSITATLIGIAQDQGLLSLEDPISKYLETDDLNHDYITIRHLLSMTSGIVWAELDNVSEFNRWVVSKDPVQYVLDRPILDPPGTRFSYNSAAIHLLSVILTKVSGMSTLAFAKQFLLDPLNIEKVGWDRIAEGYYNGGAGLQMKPRDMVKIGELYRNFGTYQGRRVVSEEFIKQAISPQAKGLPEGVSPSAGYGYCWWMDGDGDLYGYMASGFAGQVIGVVPDLDLVMVVTHRWQGVRGHVNAQQRMAQSTLIKLVAEGVLDME